MARIFGNILIFLVRFLLLFFRGLGIYPRGMCRHTPTCSHYFEESIHKKGPIKGSIAGFLRVLRCHPFAKSSYDPVQ